MFSYFRDEVPTCLFFQVWINTGRARHVVNDLRGTVRLSICLPNLIHFASVHKVVFATLLELYRIFFAFKLSEFIFRRLEKFFLREWQVIEFKFSKVFPHSFDGYSVIFA